MVVESQSQPRGESPSRSPEQTQPLSEESPPTPPGRTRTDGFSPPVWLGHCQVIRLRDFDTDTVHDLPGGDIVECLIGCDPFVELRLLDPKGFVSRRHGRLVRAGAFWQIEDLRSKNGLCEDGVPRDKFPLVPGVEVRIGSLTLVAENLTLIHLRKYLLRVLGWDAASRRAVDAAFRTIRAAANQRAPLVIAGADDLVAVARQIHLRTTAPGAPFVVCGPKPRQEDATLRVTATHPDATVACELAAGGTVCVRADDLPVGFDHLVEVSRDRRAQARLIICAIKTSKRMNATAPSILVPRLEGRPASHIHRIVSEYAIDSINELGAAPTSFTDANREWVTAEAATSFAEIEIATLRLAALNDAGNVHRAAARLGISHGALGNWFARRGIKP